MDYLTDDESEGDEEFKMALPDLDAMIHEFEEGDEVLAKEEETFKTHLSDLKSRGFEKETREEIKQLKKERVEILEANISG